MPQPQAGSDADLVVSARAGNDDAFAALYERYFPGVYDFLTRMLRDRDEAADIAQDTFIKAFQQLERLQKPASFKSWLFTIAHRTALNRIQRRKRAVVTSPTDSDDRRTNVLLSAVDEDRFADPEQAAEADAVSALVWEAAESLDPRTYAVLDLTVRRGLTSAEVADVLGVTKGNAYTMVNRMKKSVGESIGTYLLVRKGSRDCENLQAIVAAADVPPVTPELRKTVDRHVRNCDVCDRNRKALLVPLEVFAGLALVPAPAGLKGAIWAQIAAALGLAGSQAGGGGGAGSGTGGGGAATAAAAAAGTAAAAGVAGIVTGNGSGAAGGGAGGAGAGTAAPVGAGSGGGAATGGAATGAAAAGGAAATAGAGGGAAGGSGAGVATAGAGTVGGVPTAGATGGAAGGAAGGAVAASSPWWMSGPFLALAGVVLAAGIGLGVWALTQDPDPIDPEVLGTIITQPDSASTTVPGGTTVPGPGTTVPGDGTTDTTAPGNGTTPTTGAPGPAPVAVGDDFTVDASVTTVLQVLANDSGPLEPGTLQVIDPPASGTATAQANGTVLFLAPAGPVDLQFTYSVEGTDGSAAQASVIVRVRASVPAGTPPSVVDDSVGGPEDTPIAIDVLANDSDPDEGLDASSLVLATSPANGTASVSGSAITYLGSQDFNGSDTFTYRVCDTAGACAQGTVSVSISPVNDAPVSTLTGPFTIDEDGVLTLEPTALVTDPDGDPLTLASFDATSQQGGTIVEGSLIYTPMQDFAGPDSFCFTIQDPSGSSSTVCPTVDVMPVNDAPTLPDGVEQITATTGEDQPVTVPVTQVLADPDGDTLQIVGVSGISGNAAVVFGTTNVTVLPGSDWSGIVGLTASVSDGTGQFPIPVEVTVTPVNDAPEADDLEVTTDEDTPVDVPWGGSDVDGDNVGLNAYDTTTDQGGTVSIQSPTLLRYTPPEEYSGPDSFTYTVTDGELTDFAVVAITVDPVNDPPVADDVEAATDEDVSVQVAWSGSDVEGDALSLDSFDAVSAQGGSIEQGESGDTLIYTPPQDFNGEDTFTYTITDGSAMDDGTVTVEVTPVNDPPVADDLVAATDEDLSVQVAWSGSDVEGDALSLDSFDAVSAQGGSIGFGEAEGTLVYTPPQDFFGEDSFTYTISDGSLTGGGTVTITVDPVNDPPVAEDVEATTDEDVPVDVEWSGSDVESEPLSLQDFDAVSSEGGTVTQESETTLRYTPPKDFFGEDTFTYTITDGMDSGTATVTVTVEESLPPEVEPVDVLAIPELPVNSGVIATVKAFDPEGAKLTYSIGVNGFEDYFSINSGGQLKHTPLDFETDPVIIALVVVTDPSGDSASVEIVIEVLDVDEAPIVPLQLFALSGDFGPEDPIGTLDAADPEGGPVFFRKANESVRQFDIDPETGQIFVTGETAGPGGTYLFDVVVSDAGKLETRVTVPLHVLKFDIEPAVIATLDPEGEECGETGSTAFVDVFFLPVAGEHEIVDITLLWSIEGGDVTEPDDGSLPLVFDGKAMWDGELQFPFGTVEPGFEASVDIGFELTDAKGRSLTLSGWDLVVVGCFDGGQAQAF